MIRHRVLTQEGCGSAATRRISSGAPLIRSFFARRPAYIVAESNITKEKV